jgi:type VI secretion system protein ImpF
MAFQLDLLVTLSVFDRLIDEFPVKELPEGEWESRESRGARLRAENIDPRTLDTPMSRKESKDRLKAAVRRDLEWLLNTRRVADEPGEDLVEVQRSVYVYGLPDVSSVSLARFEDQQELLAAIQKSIAYFEPRLREVKVLPVTGFTKRRGEKSHVQRLDFRIEALLMMEPAPEHVSFDTSFDTIHQTYRVKGEGAEA